MPLRRTVKNVSELAIDTPMLPAKADDDISAAIEAARRNFFMWGSLELEVSGGTVVVMPEYPERDEAGDPRCLFSSRSSSVAIGTGLPRSILPCPARASDGAVRLP
jgi:hypothetical protein